MKQKEWTAQQRRYYSDIKWHLHCGGKLRRQILSDLAAAIEDCPEIDRTGLERRFGTPEQFARNVKDSMEPEQLLQAQALFWKRSFAALAAIVLIGAGGYFCRPLLPVSSAEKPAASASAAETLPSGNFEQALPLFEKLLAGLWEDGLIDLPDSAGAEA